MQKDFEQKLTDVLCDVRIPIENVTFALEQFMHQRGRQLDTETRALLGGVQTCLDQVARSARQITESPSAPVHAPFPEHHALAS